MALASSLKPQAFLKPDVLQQVVRLDLKAKFLVEGFLSGLHASPFKGFSVEFSEHRRYVPGDDVRTIDWKLFARTNRYYVKQFQAETNVQAMLLVDASASMGYAGRTGGSVTKLEYATYLSAALAVLMIRQQDPVGAVTFGRGVRAWIKPKTTRRHLLRILKCLTETRPEGETGVADILHEAARRLDRRGLVIIMSDLLDDPDRVLDGLRHLRYRGHDVIVFHVLDADETRFPFDGLCTFQDLETGRELTADGPSLRAAYLDALNAFIETYRREMTREHIDYILMDTATQFDKALLAYLVRRAGR